MTTNLTSPIAGLMSATPAEFVFTLGVIVERGWKMNIDWMTSCSARA